MRRHLVPMVAVGSILISSLVCRQQAPQPAAGAIPGSSDRARSGRVFQRAIPLNDRRPAPREFAAASWRLLETLLFAGRRSA